MEGCNSVLAGRSRHSGPVTPAFVEVLHNLFLIWVWLVRYRIERVLGGRMRVESTEVVRKHF